MNSSRDQRTVTGQGAAVTADPAASRATTKRALPSESGRRRWRLGSVELLALLLFVAILIRGPLAGLAGHPVLQSWSTVFVAISVQATPFLLLGVIVSGVIAAFIPAAWFTRVLPSSPALAIPAAGAAGIILPGCECGSVPIANRLMGRGVRPGAALAFLLSAPAINPIVLVATAVAFAGEPAMAWARLLAGLLTAVIVGYLWDRFGRPEWLRPKATVVDEQLRDRRGRWRLFVSTSLGDFAQAAGFLAVGAAAAATFKTVVPARILESIGSSVLWSVLLMAGLAFVLALCSEADAFVAASFAAIPLVGKLVFLTVGPAIDVKLVALQAGVFGRRFAVRFSPLTFVVALTVGTTVGLLFWGAR